MAESPQPYSKPRELFLAPGEEAAAPGPCRRASPGALPRSSTSPSPREGKTLRQAAEMLLSPTQPLEQFPGEAQRRLLHPQPSLVLPHRCLCGQPWVHGGGHGCLTHRLRVPLTTVPIKDPGALTAAPTPNLPAVPWVPERQDRTPARCPGRAHLASALPGAAARKRLDCPVPDHGP